MLRDGILETKANDGSTAAKAPAPRTNPKANEVLTAPKPHTHASHPQTPRPSTRLILRFYILFHFAVCSKLFFFFQGSALSVGTGRKINMETSLLPKLQVKIVPAYGGRYYFLF
jgi:hypothetical protein